MQYMITIKELNTKRCIIRPYKLSDSEDLIEGLNEYDVVKWLEKIPYPYTKKDAIDYLKSKIKNKKENTNYSFAIYHKKDNKMIGHISINIIDQFSGIGSTGSWINKKYQRQGYMTEAKIAINNFAFNKLKLNRLESTVIADNVSSNKTQKKLGYILEGIKRKAVKSRITKNIYDLNIYGLLKEDWNKIKKNFIK